MQGQNSIVAIVFLSIFLGAAPVLFYVWLFYLKRTQKFQRVKNPTGLLVLMFLGGIAAVIAAFFTEKFLIAFVPANFAYWVAKSPLCLVDDPFTVLVLAAATFGIVGPVEELYKCAAAYFISYKQPRFIRQIDGLKFGVAVALGFAAAENTLYLTPSLQSFDLNTFVSTFVVRFIYSTLAHALYTGIFGYYLGKAQFVREGRGRLLLRGLLLAILMHGLFDFVAFYSPVGFYLTIVVAVMLAFLYYQLKQPENFAIRIPEFLRRKPAEYRKAILKVPVERASSPYGYLGTIQAEIADPLAPVLPADIKPEYLPSEVPSEFMPQTTEESVRRDLKLPGETVTVRRFGPAETAAPKSRLGPHPERPQVTAPPQFTSQSAAGFVDRSVADGSRRRMQLIEPEPQQAA
ncbi:MAG: PrsW family intramembrane metalloprotease [Candidatus Andersenbacteria bacterium]